jgi:hypothetical protein
VWVGNLAIKASLIIVDTFYIKNVKIQLNRCVASKVNSFLFMMWPLCLLPCAHFISKLQVTSCLAWLRDVIVAILA